MNEYIILLTICIIIGIIYGLIEAKVKGFLGEYTVSSILSSLPEEEYRVLNNIMLPTVKGTTQIDHIVVSIYGIFVIETKNYQGWITGEEHSEQWTKNMYGKKYKFYNPLRQNYGHIKTLQAILDVPNNYYISIVAFSSKATIKVNTTEHVVYFSKLKKVIKQYQTHIIEKNQLNDLIATILNANIDSTDNRKEHIKSIKNNIKTNQKSINSGICPKCGGKLVKRKGKYGQFLGCSNYPKCRYTKNQ